MDIGMPIKDGYEATKEILEMQKNLKNMNEKDKMRINENC